jgi:hypothetical protein
MNCAAWWRDAIGHDGASGHVRPDASGHDGSSLDRDQTLALSRPVVAWSASGRCIAGAGAMRSARPVVAFDRWRIVTVGGSGGRC